MYPVSPVTVTLATDFQISLIFPRLSPTPMEAPFAKLQRHL